MKNIEAHDGIQEVSLCNNLDYIIEGKKDGGVFEQGCDLRSIVSFLTDNKPDEYYVYCYATDMDGIIVDSDNCQGDTFLEDIRRFEYLANS